MKRLALSIVAVLATACDQQPSETEFRDRFVAALRDRLPQVSIETTGDLGLTIRNNGKESLAALDTGYAEYVAKPAERDSIVDKWVAIAVQAVSDGFQVERENLVYVLRHKDYLSNVPQPNNLIWRPFAGDLVLLMVLDSPTSLRGVSANDLAALNALPDEAWTLAHDNLKTRMGPISLGDLNGDGPFAYTADSGLATGLLAHPDECGPDAAKAEDGRIVLVLDRNTWISTLPSDPLSVERFWAFAKPYLGKGQLMSDTPLTCRNGNWEAAPIPN